MEDIPHRDIFAGLLTQELASKGFFGKELDLYSFLAWQEDAEALVFSNEVQCVAKMLEFYNKGWIVTDYLTTIKRDIPRDMSPEEIWEQCRKETQDELGESLETKIKAFEALPDNPRQELYESFLAALPSSHRRLTDGLLGLGLHAKHLTKVQAEELRERYGAPAANNLRFAGFATLGNAGVSCHAFGYGPSAWRAWTQQEGAIRSALLVGLLPEGTKPFGQLRGEAQAELSQYFNELYFDLLL